MTPLTFEEEVLEAMAIITKAVRANKPMVEYKLWEHLDFEAREEALKRFHEFKDMLLLGYTWSDVVEMVNSNDTLSPWYEDGAGVAEALA